MFNIFDYVSVYGKARVCVYDACYYCYECHENEEYHIPSRIIHNWDFNKHKGMIQPNTVAVKTVKLSAKHSSC